MLPSPQCLLVDVAVPRVCGDSGGAVGESDYGKHPVYSYGTHKGKRGPRQRKEMRGEHSCEEWMKRLAEGLSMVWSYGRITYLDSLETGIEHETKWFYWHIAPNKSALPIPDPMRPEHNTYT